MTTPKLDPSTPNNDVGLYFTKTRRVDPLAGGLPYKLPELASGMQAPTAGTLVWRNEFTEEEGVITFEAGEWKPIPCTEVLATATIDGVLETTAPTAGWFWTASAQKIG